MAKKKAIEELNDAPEPGMDEDQEEPTGESNAPEAEDTTEADLLAIQNADIEAARNAPPKDKSRLTVDTEADLRKRQNADIREARKNPSIGARTAGAIGIMTPAQIKAEKALEAKKLQDQRDAETIRKQERQVSQAAFIKGKPQVKLHDLRASCVIVRAEDDTLFYLDPSHKSGEYLLRVVPG